MNPPSQKAPEATYELKKEITGEGPVIRGPQIIKDSKGHGLKVPFPPNPNCKKCHGRGYTGFDLVNHRMLPCIKCYPLSKQ